MVGQKKDAVQGARTTSRGHRIERPRSRGRNLRSSGNLPLRASAKALWLIELLLPSGRRYVQHHANVRSELLERFSGVTSYMRSPARGLWKGKSRTVADDVIVHEVLAPRLDTRWWATYRQSLEARFEQTNVLIHAARVTRL